MSDTKSSPRRTYTRREKVTAAAVSAVAVVALGGGAWVSSRDDGQSGDAPKPIAQQYDEAQAELMRGYDPPGRDTSKKVCQQVVDDLDVYADRELYPRVGDAAEELRRIHRCDRWKLAPMTEAREKLEKAARQKRDAAKPKPAASTAPGDGQMGGPYPGDEQPTGGQEPLWKSDPAGLKAQCSGILDAHDRARQAGKSEQQKVHAANWEDAECVRAGLRRWATDMQPLGESLS